MNFDRSPILSYLEEDNVQRAYFRVLPLLSLEGDIRQEALRLWPNEGGLRIVPDRNEQHTFKMRMRKLGTYCVIDLRDQPQEAGKIRTNKNFKPDRGEVNQFILYSDTVRELPEDTFYQLMEGDIAQYQALAQEAITPLFYIQQGETLYGPVRRDAPVPPEPTAEAACVLYELPCPDNVTRRILCMEDARPVEKPAPVQAAAPAEVPSEPRAEAGVPLQAAAVPAPDAEESLPIGASLHILDSTSTHEETLRQLNKPVSESANLLHQKQTTVQPIQPPVQRDASLTGTPLVRKPLHVASQPTKNRTQEVISNQWSIGKFEPPAQNLPAGAALRTVTNPVEAACHSLREAWQATNSHDQLLDCLLSLEGVRMPLEAKLCNGNSVTMMQRVLRQRLQDLEAERLTALCELDRARRDADAYKQEIMTGLAARITRELGQMQSDRQTAAEQVDTLKKEINALTLQRDALLAKVEELNSSILPEAVAKITAEAQMVLPVAGVPLRMHPVSGETAEAEAMIARLSNSFAESGVAADRNTVIALLVLLAVCPRIGISCPTPAAMSTLCRNLANAMGWQDGYVHQYTTEQQPMAGMRPVDSTPAIWATSLPNYAPVAGVTKLLLNRNVMNLTRNAAYDVCQWPVVMMPALPYIPAVEAAKEAPVSMVSIARLAQTEAVTSAELDAALAPVLSAAIPLNSTAHKELYRFISVCAGLMEGGLPVAADWGILLWIVPALERGSRHYAAVKAVLDEYPLSLSML